MLSFNTSNKEKFTAAVLSLVFSTSYLGICCQSAFAEASALNFKVYNPDQTGSDPANANTSSPAGNTSQAVGNSNAGLSAETPQPDVSADKTAGSSTTTPEAKSVEETNSNSGSTDDAKTETSVNTANTDNTNQSDSTTKVLQGYVKIVPSGTKIPIVMDTAVDSDTSQEGDEFSARTVEDLTIDGTMVIPAGSIIRGRIATLNAPKHLNRSGSVALKFDTVTTPDNRQIPLVANLVARGGVVHARRGMKDIAIDTATFALPTLVALGIGAVAGHSSSSVGVGGGALIGAGVGAAVGLAILMAKKGKKVDVRPGDELKIELAEDLHMPAM